MTKTMHAAVVEQRGQKLVRRKMDISSPGQRQILVKTEACDLCAQTELGSYTGNRDFAEYILADPDYVAHVPATPDLML